MRAILLVGHGSRDPEGNEQVKNMIEELSTKLDPGLLVETCYLEFAKPTIEQGIKTCVEKGASSVFVIPLMLLAAGHSKIHIPAAIDEAKERYPQIQFTYGRPFGIHEETLEICKDRLVEVGENVDNADPDTAIVLLGRGGSDPDANSDLYKMTRLLWEKLNYKLVEPAFMGVTDPLIKEGVERCIKLGAKRVVILPYFLFTGILIKRLEKMVKEFEQEYPGISFNLAGYFGFHSRLQTIIKDRIEEALQGEVKMNCDTCIYRIDAMEHIDHHHHHDHEHDHHHHHDHDHHEVQKV
ncbi:sirohydrochlorin chelatase [Alkalihalophilus pseudofirmus]|uniref:Sirohydrochlorin chelatase n=1 Tax=Alkalihalophilus pseudofirmus TaxID=79885 RepID=A0AAJ2NNA5_ALKPS|nr:sirohydrochlorin chelatase [Alkalihalophilus pseudofirmus]MDV2885506.1 sirohydrochlorin chelatase [Alkalihalophilus pseudofirmus]